MIRVTLTFTVLSALIMALTAGLMRWELAAPGLVLFIGDGAPDSQTYTRVVQVHGIAGFALMAWLGLLLAAIGVRDGARVHRLWLWPGLVLGLALAALTGGMIFAPEALLTHAPGLSWVEYGLTFGPADSILPPSPGFLPPDPGGRPLLADLRDSAYLAAPALLVAGLMALLGRAAGFRGLSVIGVLATFVTFALLLQSRPVADGDLLEAMLVYFAPLLIFMGGAAVRLVDRVDPALAMALIGALAAFVLFLTEVTFTYYPSEGTVWITGLLHLSVFALPVFAFVAAIMALRDRALPPALTWAAPAALIGGTLLAFLPLLELGAQGMPTRYADFPSAFADLSQQASLGALLLFVAVFVTLALVRRAR